MKSNLYWKKVKQKRLKLNNQQMLIQSFYFSIYQIINIYTIYKFIFFIRYKKNSKYKKYKVDMFLIDH